MFTRLPSAAHAQGGTMRPAVTTPDADDRFRRVLASDQAKRGTRWCADAIHHVNLLNSLFVGRAEGVLATGVHTLMDAASGTNTQAFVQHWVDSLLLTALEFPSRLDAATYHAASDACVRLLDGSGVILTRGFRVRVPRGARGVCYVLDSPNVPHDATSERAPESGEVVIQSVQTWLLIAITALEGRPPPEYAAACSPVANAEAVLFIRSQPGRLAVPACIWERLAWVEGASLHAAQLVDRVTRMETNAKATFALTRTLADVISIASPPLHLACVFARRQRGAWGAQATRGLFFRLSGDSLLAEAEAEGDSQPEDRTSPVVPPKMLFPPSASPARSTLRTPPRLSPLHASTGSPATFSKFLSNIEQCEHTLGVLGSDFDSHASFVDALHAANAGANERPLPELVFEARDAAAGHYVPRWYRTGSSLSQSVFVFTVDRESPAYAQDEFPALPTFTLVVSMWHIFRLMPRARSFGLEPLFRCHGLPDGWVLAGVALTDETRWSLFRATQAGEIAEFLRILGSVLAIDTREAQRAAGDGARTLPTSLMLPSLPAVARTLPLRLEAMRSLIDPSFVPPSSPPLAPSHFFQLQQ